jgi:hypothetical protein
MRHLRGKCENGSCSVRNRAGSLPRLNGPDESSCMRASRFERCFHNLAGPVQLLALLLVLVAVTGCGPKPTASTATTSSATCGAFASWGGQRSTRLTPSPAGVPLLAYDAGHHQLVMYGNRNAQTPDLGVTWTWNGTDWAEADRTGDFMAATMVYDAKLGSIVAFDFFTPTPEAHLWNGSSWSRPITGGPMPPRDSPGVAYDPISGNVVVFGGQTEFPPAILGDTWTWDGNQWGQQHPPTSPTPRDGAVLRYDPASRKLLLFGGLTSTSWSRETWAWDGSTWTQLAPSASPPATTYVAATDPGTGAPLLIGRTPVGSGPTYHWEQWRWTGNTWQAQMPGVHPDRLPEANAYDEGNRYTLAVVPPGPGELDIATWILR